MACVASFPNRNREEADAQSFMTPRLESQAQPEPELSRAPERICRWRRQNPPGTQAVRIPIRVSEVRRYGQVEYAARNRTFEFFRQPELAEEAQVQVDDSWPAHGIAPTLPNRTPVGGANAFVSKNVPPSPRLPSKASLVGSR